MKSSFWTRVVFRLFIIVLLLAGCSQESDITLYEDGTWEFASSFSFNPDDIPNIKVDIPVVEEMINLAVDTPLLPDSAGDLALEMIANIYRQQGYRVETDQKWVLGGDTRYLITISGVGWEKLAGLFTNPTLEEYGMPASNASIVEMQDGAVHFVVELPVDTFGLGSMVPTEFRLHGRSIVDTNAHEVSGGTATWYGINSYMEATVIPKSHTNWPLIIGIAIGVIVLMGIGFLVMVRMGGGRSRRPRRRPRNRGTSRRSRRPGR